MGRKRNEHELVVGEGGALGVFVGTRSEDTVPIEFEKIGAGVDKVVPAQLLDIGEYYFFYAGTSRAYRSTGKLLDFEIYREC